MVLSLKGTLLYYLSKVLPGRCEVDVFSFINFLHLDRSRSDSVHRINSASFVDRQRCWQQIPLQKKQQMTAALYTSAIPQMLAKSPQFVELPSLTEVSRQTANQLNQLQLKTLDSELDHKNYDLSLLPQLWSEFEIETQRPGWVSFRLSEVGTSLWLQQFLQPEHSSIFLNSAFSKLAQPLPKLLDGADLDHTQIDDQLMNSSLKKPIAKDRSKSSSVPVCFPRNCLAAGSAASNPGSDLAGADLYGGNATIWRVQYTHARCCTLLRLWQAVQPDLCMVGSPLVGSPLNQASVPATLPWLTADQQLRFHTLQAQRLIQTLIATADDLFWIPYRWPDRSYLLLLKCAGQLCQSFEQFYSACLCGFSQISAPSVSSESRLFQARFGLVAATQNLLETLLQGHLAVTAPDLL